MPTKRSAQKSISYYQGTNSAKERARVRREELPTLDSSFQAKSSQGEWLRDEPTDVPESFDALDNTNPELSAGMVDPQSHKLDAVEALLPLQGQTIGNLEILEEIGKGGFCTVYRAQQFPHNTCFAVKVLDTELPTEADIERFKREALTLSRLTHPNIVRFFDFGFLHGKGFYLVMEYLEGQTLTQRINSQGLPSIKEVQFICEHLCEILQYIHEKRIWHRDLKPSNIVIKENQDGLTQLKLIDFGVALSADEEKNLTQKGTCVGTARYLSPEQIQMVKDLDGRSDLYAFSLLLHLMLTGKLPFELDKESVIKGMHNKLTQSPTLLEESAPKKEWAPELEDFLQKALGKDREQRFLDANDFWKALEHGLSKQQELEDSRKIPKVKYQEPTETLPFDALPTEVDVPIPGETQGVEQNIPPRDQENHVRTKSDSTLNSTIESSSKGHRNLVTWGMLAIGILLALAVLRIFL